MKVTLGQAAKMTGKAKSTISQAVKEGVLSATRSGDTKTSPLEIDVSELMRVFPIKRPLVLDSNTSNTSPNTKKQLPERPSNTDSVSAEHSRTLDTSVELAVLREREKHHEETRRFYEERIQDLKEQLSEAKEQAEDYKLRFLEADTKLLGVLQNISSNPDTTSSEHSEHFTEQKSNTAEQSIEHPESTNTEDVIALAPVVDDKPSTTEDKPFLLSDDMRVQEAPGHTEDGATEEAPTSENIFNNGEDDTGDNDNLSVKAFLKVLSKVNSLQDKP